MSVSYHDHIILSVYILLDDLEVINFFRAGCKTLFLNSRVLFFITEIPSIVNRKTDFVIKQIDERHSTPPVDD